MGSGSGGIRIFRKVGSGSGSIYFSKAGFDPSFSIVGSRSGTRSLLFQNSDLDLDPDPDPDPSLAKFGVGNACWVSIPTNSTVGSPNLTIFFTKSYFGIRIRLDPHFFGRSDPDPDPDPTLGKIWCR